MNSTTIEPWNKLIHLILYGVFAVLGYRVLKAPRQYWYVCIGIVIYSGLIAVAQPFMPGRVMSAFDLLANTLGVVLGAVVAKKYLALKNLFKQK
jgi:VanZ family protein